MKHILIILFILVSAAGFGFAGGDGTTESPYQIATASHMDAVRNNLAAHYIVVADIDLVEFAEVEHWSVSDTEFDEPYLISTGWIPIGSYSTPFTGVFDGAGFQISNLKFRRHGISFNGLFGCTLQATVKNTKLIGVDLIGGYRTLPVVGYPRNSQTPSNSFTGSVVEEG